MIVRRDMIAFGGRCLVALLLIVSTEATFAEPLVIEVVSAEAAYDRRTSEPLVSFRMSETSARHFGELTAKNVGKKLAIRVDGQTLSAPVIREPILGGSGQISGSLTADQAKAIAERLSKGKAKLEFEIVP